MATIKQFRQLALSFPESVELPHFDNTSFRINKKIFVTLSEKEKRICVKLSEAEQNVYAMIDKSIIYPVPNKWGKQGWTFVDLTNVKKEVLIDVLTSAYCTVAPKRLTQPFLDKQNEL